MFDAFETDRDFCVVTEYAQVLVISIGRAVRFDVSISNLKTIERSTSPRSTGRVIRHLARRPKTAGEDGAADSQTASESSTLLALQ